jgi:hypothetical protein
MTHSARRGARMVIAVTLVYVGCCIGPVVGTARAQSPKIKGLLRAVFDRKASIADELPTPPDAVAARHPWLVRDLADVPQVVFQKPEAQPRKPRPEPKTFAERDREFQRELDEQQKANEKTAQMMAKINGVNSRGRDRFIAALRDHREDIAGLPFLLGGACRLSAERSAAFVKGVAVVRGSMPVAVDPKAPPRDPANEATRFWVGYTMRTVWGKGRPQDQAAVDLTAARIAALMQVLGPEHSAFHKRLVKYLSETDGAAATTALARLAVFSFDKEVRTAAIAALKARPNAGATDVIVAGLRYPWPAVADNAGEAAIQLGRKDLVPKLVALLDEPDRRAPAMAEVNGKPTLAVREVVRLNHLRSCVMCHPPANLKVEQINSDGAEPKFVTAPVPNPDLPPRSRSLSGYDSLDAPPEIFIRDDVTYLRQDFSLMQLVGDGSPTPAMQRFDFLVRTRPVAATAQAEYENWRREQGPDYLAPHQRAAVAALRALTGRVAAQPTAQAWRAALAK